MVEEATLVSGLGYSQLFLRVPTCRFLTNAEADKGFIELFAAPRQTRIRFLCSLARALGSAPCRTLQ